VAVGCEDNIEEDVGKEKDQGTACSSELGDVRGDTPSIVPSCRSSISPDGGDPVGVPPLPPVLPGEGTEIGPK